jgi:hypothetical protein
LTNTVNRWVRDDLAEIHPCTSAGFAVVACTSGNIYDADCDNGHCATCGVRRAQTRAVAITWMQRQCDRSRLITFTRCPPVWQARRGQIYDIRRRLIKAGYSCEWIWATERGSKTGMWHVHAIQHGSYIPQATLQDMWGKRLVDVRAVHDAGQYISKSAARVANYLGKGATGRGDGLGHHLGVNGGRLHHWSRDFWGGLSIRDAVKASRGERPCEQYVSVWRGQDDDDALRRRALRAVVSRPAHHIDGSVRLA